MFRLSERKTSLRLYSQCSSLLTANRMSMLSIRQCALSRRICWPFALKSWTLGRRGAKSVRGRTAPFAVVAPLGWGGVRAAHFDPSRPFAAWRIARRVPAMSRQSRAATLGRVVLRLTRTAPPVSSRCNTASGEALLSVVRWPYSGRRFGPQVDRTPPAINEASPKPLAQAANSSTRASTAYKQSAWILCSLLHEEPRIAKFGGTPVSAPNKSLSQSAGGLAMLI